jgi:altronate hydrolase
MTGSRPPAMDPPGESPGPVTAIVLHQADTVAVLTGPVQPGDLVAAGTEIITAADPIPAGHKIARRGAAAGDPVLKYGEVIGRASAAFQPGSHVHVHNLASARLPGPTAGGS